MKSGKTKSKILTTVIPCEQAHAPEADFLGFDA
jgi:hypothetical protein